MPMLGNPVTFCLEQSKNRVYVSETLFASMPGVVRRRQSAGHIPAQ